MKLRTITPLATGLVVAACAALTFTVSYVVFTVPMRGSAESAASAIRVAEDRRARAVVVTVAQILAADEAALLLRVTDLARKDDTYLYVQTRSPAFRRANLPDSIVGAERLSLVVIADTAGRIVDRLSYDPDRRVFRDVPASLVGRLQPGSRLSRFGVASSISGTLLLPEGALLFAAAPITPATYAGPSRGTLLMGRFLGTAEAQRLTEQAGARVEVYRADASELPADVRRARDSGPGTSLPVAGESAGHLVLPDPDGAPALILRVQPADALADTAARALEAIDAGLFAQATWLLAALVGSLVVIIGVAVLVVELAVLRRTSALRYGLESIASQPRLGARVLAHGDDEMARLEISVNEVLAALETTQQGYTKRARSLETMLRTCRLALQATAQVAFELDLGGGRMHLDGAVTRLTGYALGELASIPMSAWEAMLHPQDRRAATSAAEQATTGAGYRSVYRLRRKDGSYTLLEERGARVQGPGSRVIGILRAMPSAPAGGAARPTRRT